MTKLEAIRLLGATQHQEAATLLGVTKGAWSMWPATLTTAQADRVRGAAIRLGRLVCQQTYQPDEVQQ